MFLGWVLNQGLHHDMSQPSRRPTSHQTTHVMVTWGLEAAKCYRQEWKWVKGIWHPVG